MLAKAQPIDKVGLYIPGGTAPLFSTVLMLAVPAQLAGCGEIVLCSPPGKEGKIHPAILYTAHLCGIRRIFKIGGVQAIGAMAYGTETVPQVYKIFGRAIVTLRQPSNWSVSETRPSTCRQGLPKYWLWPTRQPYLLLWPQTCFRRPSTATTARLSC